jgi:hypothetical protein
MRKPGLWFSAMKVEVEDVTDRHKKVCLDCGQLPVGRRLKIVKGSGRHQTVEIRCSSCGEDWLKQKEIEAARARRYLRQDIGAMKVECIRLPKETDA